MTTGFISDFVSNGIPIGSTLPLANAVVNFTQNGLEYLRTGNIKSYDASYAPAMVSAPQLRVFGNLAGSLGSGVGAVTGIGMRYYFIGGNYIVVPSTGASGSFIFTGTTLALALAGGSSIAGSNSAFNQTAKPAVNGAMSIVCSHRTANTAFLYSTDGATMAAVGGVFTTCPVKSALCFGNSSWLALSSLNATAGEQAYLAAANPSGAWTIGAGTNIGMTQANAVNYGAALFVAVGASASTTTGLIATCAAVGGAWTDRTAASGITFATSESIVDAVFDGTRHVAITSTGRVITSADGITWTLSAGFSYETAMTVAVPLLVTDGAGTVIACPKNPASTLPPVYQMSTDHGASWSPFQSFCGSIASQANVQNAISYCNAQWLENHSGSLASCTNLGASIVTPNYVGQQYAPTAGQYVRIK